MGGGGTGIAGSGGAFCAMSVVAASETSKAESNILLIMFTVMTSFIHCYWSQRTIPYQIVSCQPIITPINTKGGAHMPRLHFFHLSVSICGSIFMRSTLPQTFLRFRAYRPRPASAVPRRTIVDGSGTGVLPPVSSINRVL